MKTIMCPICRQLVYIYPDEPICLPHADKTGLPCPMSGQPIGNTPE